MNNANNIFRYITPEEAGIPSGNVEKFIRTLENTGMAVHDVILARGNDIFFEAYWAPFHKEYLHREYSITKSYVAIAIGFLEQDGLIDLDDPMEKFFPEELKNQPDRNQHKQTIRHMLMMTTAKPPRSWRRIHPDDWVKHYFSNLSEETRPGGTVWQYDSIGSHVLGAIVERVTGKTLMDYLREKLFDKIGFSSEAYCLKAPGGHSWMDAGLLCKPSDLLRTIRFLLNGGSWNGEQILNEDYVKAAISTQFDNTQPYSLPYRCQGYGYQIWKCYQDSFLFSGMHTQLAVGVPGKDIIFIYNSDHLGKYYAENQTIMDSFFDLIVNPAGKALPADTKAHEHLLASCRDLKLRTAAGETTAPTAERVNGITYTMDENPMAITRMRFTFAGEKGCLAYTNAQGDKELHFGLGQNAFVDFPEEGYSDEVASEYAPGNYYTCAASAAWEDENTLQILVQIIDTYLGSLHITVHFDGDEISVTMYKDAEDFLNEYTGEAYGKA
ncbi:MAG: serine hydrolase [Ruminococcaceae bacterium]|nr:serine hydrolase [Oscillospiraceae bacterium]